MTNCCYLFLIIVVYQVGVVICDATNANINCTKTLVVDQSGNGGYSSIRSAINSVPSGNKEWICININAGNYREKVAIPRDKNYIMLNGNSRNTTKIVWSDYQGVLQELATLKVEANNFVAKNISFINDHNYPTNNGKPRVPAPAAFLGGDMISFFDCDFYGLQDTLFDHRGRHYFSRCKIVGAVDFIFGAGQSMYEDSIIRVIGASLKPDGTEGFITANGRDSPNSTSYFIFKNCMIVGEGKTYLGRPWRPYARVLFYNTFMSDVVVPQGWSPWRPGQKSEDSVFSEHQCTGPGSDKSKRVPWIVELSDENVKTLVSKSFVDSNNWIESRPM